MRKTFWNVKLSIMQIVLSIYKFFNRGGAQRDLIRTAAALRKRGADVLVLCAEAHDPAPEGCQLQILPVKGWSNHRRMQSFEQAVAAFRQHNPQLVLLGFGRMGQLDMYFAADDCLRTIWRNKLLNWLLPRKRVFLHLEAAAMRTPVIFTLTGRQERDYKTWYAVDAERFKRLPPGIDRKYQNVDKITNACDYIRSKFAVPAGNFVIVQAAASFHTKGVDRTLAMLNSLPDELKQKITLIVAGDDTRREKYRRLGEMLKLDVRFPGGCDDLEMLYKGSDLMLHPARNEATGTVLIEALCCGLPVLTTDRCGYAEYLTGSGGGVVLPEPFRLDHWVQALKKLLAEPQHLQQCRVNTKDLHKSDFWFSRPEVTADEIIKFARTKESDNS